VQHYYLSLLVKPFKLNIVIDFKWFASNCHEIIGLILLLIKIRFSSKNVSALTQRQFRRVNT